MQRDDAEEFTQALGQIAGGTWRQIALAKRLGVPQALGLSTDKWVNERLGGYVRMNIEDRREAVAELAAEGQSTRQIAEVLGVGHATAARDIAGVSNETVEPEHAEGDDDPTVSNETDAKPAKPIDALAAILTTEQMRDAQAHNHRAQGSGEDEWYTPAEYLKIVRAFLGGIDLDPASSDIAQRTVKATRYLTIKDDGLRHEWQGRIWLNPPYAQPAISHFVRKMVDSVGPGVEAVMLTHNYTDTEWFQTAVRAATAICFTRGRIAFVSPSGMRASPTQGQAFFYFGPQERTAQFARAFDPVGTTLVQGLR